MSPGPFSDVWFAVIALQADPFGIRARLLAKYKKNT